jgi:hypothetical protein
MPYSKVQKFLKQLRLTKSQVVLERKTNHPMGQDTLAPSKHNDSNKLKATNDNASANGHAHGNLKVSTTNERASRE